MKLQTLIIILLAAGLAFVSFKWAQAVNSEAEEETLQTDTSSGATTGATKSSDANSSASTNISNGEFKPFEVTSDWHENPFTWFKGAGLLLAVGDKESNNAMTIGWGSLGNIWRDLGNSTVTVYVSESRYTYQFMEKYKYFTIMAFDKKYDGVLEYMGTHSGRDGDKAKALGLHTLYTENGTPYYQEASMVLECEIVYKDKFRRDGMNGDLKDFYDNFPAAVHHFYIGNIVSALKK